MKIPEWKWEEVEMDFIVGLPRTQTGYDSIWVIVDRLTKVTHFIPIKITYSGTKLVELYMERIVCFMVYQRRLFQIGVQSSHHIFGRNCMSPWI